VDDDPAFRRLAGLALDEAGLELDAVATAQEALERLSGEPGGHDLLLLDQELPGMSGQELLEHLRAQGEDIPIVLVSVHDGIAFKSRALQRGADDYVVKPCSFDELMARLRAVARRCRGRAAVRIGSLEVDPESRRVTKEGRELGLTQREFEVLWVLIQAQERTVTRKEFLRRVWDMKFEPGTNFIQVHVSRLRSKLGALDGFRIEAVRGKGYRLVSLKPSDSGAAPS